MPLAPEALLSLQFHILCSVFPVRAGLKMRVFTVPLGLTTAALAVSVANGLNVLITNDDGFGTANIREMYKAMKAFGHNCYIVASADNQSGMGGRSVFTDQKTLATDSEFGIVKAGQPSIGPDPNDSHIWYYNGTPAAQVFVALDYILPNFTEFSVPDLVMSGPNYGLNLGPYLYTLSGTNGATYAAVERGIPAIAFSTGNEIQTPYYYVNTSGTAVGLRDPNTISGQLAANLAQTLIKGANGGRLLPLGYGLSVNIPKITSLTSSACIDPPFIHARMTGGADVDTAVYNASTGLFHYADLVDAGLNQCINGDCSLPGETLVLASGCKSSVSVFTVDYDAPTCSGKTGVRAKLSPLVQSLNSTSLVGGLNGTSAIFGPVNGTSVGKANSTTTTPSAKPSATAVYTSGAVDLLSNVAGAVAALALGVALPW
ncbi:MAG: hypothetical protein M1818_001659 [Claussenomyces sp. TS43310]|nr:MAG: hypothetical protein M1818_001659 [Claussenomyces sp. TS43310]